MDQRNNAQTRLWIQDRDSLGNTVDQRLIEAAYQVWERSRQVVLRYLGDDTEAPEILEAAVDSASRAMRNAHPIKCFEPYLLKSVSRESIRRFQRNRRVEYMDAIDIEGLATPLTEDLDQQLDNAKRIQVFRACLDDQGRKMYDLRLLDYDWQTIAKYMGYADAHSAEVQFLKKFKKALVRFQRMDA